MSLNLHIFTDSVNQMYKKGIEPFEKNIQRYFSEYKNFKIGKNFENEKLSKISESENKLDERM